MADSHYCTLHKTVFFMKGKMKGYAHPVKDEEGNTIEWCNEEDLEKVRNLPPREPEMLPEHKDIVTEARKMGAEVTSSSGDTRLRSMAVAYAKDLVVAGIIPLEDMGKRANWFLKYILSG